MDNVRDICSAIRYDWCKAGMEYKKGVGCVPRRRLRQATPPVGGRWKEQAKTIGKVVVGSEIGRRVMEGAKEAASDQANRLVEKGRETVEEVKRAAKRGNNESDIRDYEEKRGGLVDRGKRAVRKMSGKETQEDKDLAKAKDKAAIAKDKLNKMNEEDRERRSKLR